MKMFNLKKKRTLTLVIISIIGLGIIAPNISSATSLLSGFTTDIANLIFIGIPYMLGQIAGAGLGISAWLVDVMLAQNTQILSGQSRIISNGFKLTLSVANLGFVIALIIIAFSTILQIGEYSAKKLLGKLIIYAVLVNFSLFFAGILLDFSHVLVNSFLTVNSVGDSIASGLDPQTILIGPKSAKVVGTTLFSPAWVGVFIEAVFLLIFTWMMFFIILAVAVMFVYRYIAIVILLILMPLAWVTPLLPRMSDLGSRWWSAFIKQVFFLPAAAFFIMIAISAAQHLNPANLGAATSSLRDASLVTTLLNVFVIGGLLIASLKVASEVGGASAKLGLSIANRGKKMGLGIGRGVGRGVYQGSGAQSVIKRGAGLGSRFLALPGVRALPGAKTTSNKLAGASSRQKDAEEYRKTNYSNKNDDQVAAMPAVTPLARAAKLQELIKRKALNKLSPEELNLLIKGNKISPGAKKLLSKDDKKAILSSRPDLAAALGKGEPHEIIEAVKNMSPSKAADWPPEVLENNEVVIGAIQSKAVLTAIANGPQELQEKLRERLSRISIESPDSGLSNVRGQIANKQTEISRMRKNNDPIKKIKKVREELKDLRIKAKKLGSDREDASPTDALSYIDQIISNRTSVPATPSSTPTPPPPTTPSP